MARGKKDFYFSFCGSWNAFTIISWCIDHRGVFSLCIHGVRKEFIGEENKIHFFVFSLVAGFYAGRIYKTIKGSNWKRTAVLVCDQSFVLINQMNFSSCFLCRQQHYIRQLSLLLDFFSISSSGEDVHQALFHFQQCLPLWLCG